MDKTIHEISVSGIDNVVERRSAIIDLLLWLEMEGRSIEYVTIECSNPKGVMDHAPANR